MSEVGRRHLWVLAGLLCLSLAMNVALSRQLRSVRATLQSVREGKLLLKPGDQVPALVAEDLDGRPISVKAADSTLPTVVYVFTPQCVWCSRNLDNLHALSNVAPNRFRLVGVSLTESGLKEYIAANKLTFPILVNPTADTKRAYQLFATPVTLVINPQSVVQRAWSGAYSAQTRTDVENFFLLRLPGLRSS